MIIIITILIVLIIFHPKSDTHPKAVRNDWYLPGSKYQYDKRSNNNINNYYYLPNKKTKKDRQDNKHLADTLIQHDSQYSTVLSNVG